MKPKVIKTARDHKQALAYIEQLLDQPKPDEQELELWSFLVENYEETHFSIEKPDLVQAIRFSSDQSHGVAAHLLPYLGSKSHVLDADDGIRQPVFYWRTSVGTDA